MEWLTCERSLFLHEIKEVFRIGRKLPFHHVALPSATHGFQVAKLICTELAERKVLGRSPGESLWARSAYNTPHFYYILLVKTQS